MSERVSFYLFAQVL